MFKKIFKAAKDLVRSPVGQLGIGLLAPQLGFLKGVSPALIQGGIGLLSGAKSQEVLQGLALGTAQAGLMGGKGGISDFFRGQQPVAGAALTPTNRNISGGAMTIGDAPVNTSGINLDPIPTNANMSMNVGTSLSAPVQPKQGILRDMGLIVDTVTDPVTGRPRAANFFEKYAPIVKLGTTGAAIAAAALGAKDAQRLYDPDQNPYLASGTGDKDFFKDINPLYAAKGGGIDDFPRKTGMINGPGDGQSDSIPAMLSDGEFVMTKQAVMAAGDGDRDKGTKKMYSMMNGLEDKAKSMGIGRM